MRGTLVKLELSAWGSPGAGGWAALFEARGDRGVGPGQEPLGDGHREAEGQGQRGGDPAAVGDQGVEAGGVAWRQGSLDQLLDGEHRQQRAGVPQGSARDERHAGGAPGSGQGPGNHRGRHDGDGEAHQDRQRLGQVAVALAMESLAGGGPERQQVPELMDRERAQDEEGRAPRDGKCSDARSSLLLLLAGSPRSTARQPSPR